MKQISRPYNTIIPAKIPLDELESWGEKYVEIAKKTNSELFIITRNIFGDKARFIKEMDELQKKVQFFNERGISVGAWLCPTTGHEGMGLIIGEEGKKFTRRQVADYSAGEPRLIKQAFCPLDDGFKADFAWKMGLLCQTGATKSLFEDDFRLSGPPITKIACCCDLHMKAFSQRLNRKVDIKELPDLIYNNEDLSYRKEWMDLKKETMLSFVKALRDEVDKFNPEFRIGISASRLNYDIDGATIQEIARVAAGDTKPFVRLTGAPYWARENNTLSAVIESNRMQFGWFSGSDIEIVAEGDPYPRPRSRISAAYLEVYDQILRANGDSDGILKYVTAQCEGPFYEDGYIDFHIRNTELYRAIDKLFDGKKAVGLKPYVKQQKLANAKFDDLEPFEEFGAYYRLDSVVPPESYLVTSCSVPTSYDDCDYAGVAFGENARYLTKDQLDQGIITDLKGAKILTERGIDVGLVGYTRVHSNPSEEYFPADDISVMVGKPSPFPVRFYKTELRNGAKVISNFCYGDNVLEFGEYEASFDENEPKEDFPACYLYENKDGQRFCVYTFVALNVQNRDIYNGFNGDFFVNYCRQNQILSSAEWVAKKKLPAKSTHNPYLYILCADDKDSRVIGLWNLWEDEIFSPQIELDEPAKEIIYHFTDGYTDGCMVKLTKPLKPFECAFLEIKK
ncbi:MAG: hypothetical protein IJY70_05845 [Clostridia bacterium]|nr:hypothetical protein [Clostridia bacterium]